MRKIKPFGCIVLVIASVMVLGGIASAYTPTSEDFEFIEWNILTSEKLSEDNELITTELGKGVFDCDWEYVRTLAKLEYNHAEIALNEIDQFDVSPELKPIKKEFELCLIDLKWSAHYTKEAADDFISRDYEGASDSLHRTLDYLTSAASHEEKVDALIKALPTPTPESPGFGAIFAIGGLLAVAYLVLRRRG